MKTLHLNARLMTNLGDVLGMHTSDIIAATGIATATWYYIMQHIDGITVQQLLAIANGLKVPVRRFFSSDTTDYIGARDEYVVEPYMLCYYDADALQAVVDSRTDATWKKAADATGMTYDNLKKSTLAIRRLPVSRFLKVCEAFEVDPFTILTDPNKAKKNSRRTSGDTEIDALRKDIADLHDSIRTLSQAVADIKAEYEALAKRVNTNKVNIETISGNFIGVASET